MSAVEGLGAAEFLDSQANARLEETREWQARDLAHQEIDAVVMLMRHYLVSSGAGRRMLCTRIMVSSVFAQAALLGLVSCARCGDQTCDVCKPRWLR